MLQRLTVCLLIVLLSTGQLLAHGNATHLMGTVTAVGKDTVTIQDKDGKSVVVMVGKTTKYLKAKKPATVEDMKVGTRVVIDAQMDPKMKMYTAEEIQLASDSGAQNKATTAGKK